MSKRINNTNQRKMQILLSAKKVFIQKGYYKTTIDDIAKEEGVVRGTILHYFKSKEVLMKSVLQNSGKNFLPEIEKIMCDSKTPAKKRLTIILKMCEEQFHKVKIEVKKYSNSNNEFRFLLDQIRIHTFYTLCKPMEKLLDDGCIEGVFKIKNTKARSQSIIFAIFGITGSDLTLEEIIKETREIIKLMIS